MPITHSFVSPATDLGNPDELSPDDWNDDHVIDIDAVQNQIGNGAIVIPGLAGSPDIRVAGANDDEFDTTDTSDPMTGWTTMGSPTTHDINSTFKSHYYIRRNAAASAVDWCGIYKAPPSMPFTVTAKLAAMNGFESFNTAGIMIGQTTPGAMHTFGIRFQSGGQWGLELDLWTSPTGGGSVVANHQPLTTVIKMPLYLRIVANSDSDLDFSYSADGMLFVPFRFDTDPAYAVGSVGLVCESEDSVYPVEAAFDWIRFT